MSAGSSPSQMIAAWSPRSAKCRSRQFTDTLSFAPRNQAISPAARFSSLSVCQGSIRSRWVLAISVQKASGSSSERRQSAS